MLSVKAVNIHGMKDKRWTIRDKLNQYRGVLKLYAREKKLKAAEAVRLRKKTVKELKTLEEEIKKYQKVFDVVSNGSRKNHIILKDHQDLLLAYEHHNPADIYEPVVKDVSTKRSHLDGLYNEKKLKIKEFFDLQLEWTYVKEVVEKQDLEVRDDTYQQKIVSLYHKYLADEQVAKGIASSYHSILKILEKDSIYFNALLDALKVDRDEQGKVLYRATMMGQLAAEDLDDTRERYKKMAKAVWINTKERKRTLKNAQEQADLLWENVLKLGKVESTTFQKDEKKDENINDVDDPLETGVHGLEEMFNRVKDTLMIRSYDEMIMRFEEQALQRERLLQQFKISLEERNRVLDKKNKATMILANLDHSMVTTTGDYKANKKHMIEEIEEQKKRKDNYEKLRKSRGELLVDIKAAFQNMIGMLMHINPEKGTTGTKKGLKNTENNKKKINIKSGHDQHWKGEVAKIEKIDTDPMSLLEHVTKKIDILFTLSNFELDAENEILARDLYQKYVSDYRSKTKHIQSPSDVSALHVEHKIYDPTVMSRVDVKYQSKQVVEAHTSFE